MSAAPRQPRPRLTAAGASSSDQPLQGSATSTGAQSPESLKLAADAQALVEQLEAMPRDDSADAVEARAARRRAALAPFLSFR